LIPLVLLIPAKDFDQPVPVAMAVAQSGKRGFLTHRSTDVAALVSNGMAVCLPDLRGTGETRPGDGRGKLSADTALSSSELMLGGTMVGARLRDMRAILLYLRSRDDIDARQLFLWGDSFASTNPANTDFKVPRRVDGRPHQSEPLGGLLALLGAIFEDDVQAVYVRGGLTDFQSVLESPFVYIPHDTVIPGALTVGDLGEVAAAIAPRPLRLEAMVDGLNRRSPVDQVRKRYRQTIENYRRVGADQQFVVSDHSSAAEWLLQRIPVP
jgi:hypothetical protein